MKSLTVIFTLVAALFLSAPMTRALDVLNPLGETDAELEQRMAWFNEARFGMFIHWGAYSVLGGEWRGDGLKLPLFKEALVLMFPEIKGAVRS